MPDQITPHTLDDVFSPTSSESEVVKTPALVAQKRRSCEMVNTPSPCVNKALFHLNRLQELIKTGEGMKFESQPSILKQEHIKNEEKQKKKQIRFLTPGLTPGLTPSPEVKADTKELAVVGLGAVVPEEENQLPERLLKKIQLTPLEVFTQAADLILRLEDDRSATRSALEHERSRVGSLSLKIDEMSERRMTSLPMAVQKEHDACAFDISELQWHVSYTGRQLERSRGRVAVAEVLNNNLREEINFVKKHCPLVEEKLLIEKESMKKIKAMQKVTDNELAEAHSVLDEAEAKYSEVKERAERERQKTQQDLESVRGKLKMLKKDLHHSQAMHAAYVKKSEQSKEKLKSQGEELVRVQNRTDEVRDLEQREIYRIEELRDKVKQVEIETHEVTKEKNLLEKETEEMHSRMQSRVGGLEVKYKESLRRLRELQEENRDLNFDIEDMTDGIKTCEKAMAKATKEIVRYATEKDKCEGQLKTATDEVANISMINIELKSQFEKEETKSQALEDALKSTSENLRKQVNEEMRQRTALESKRQQNNSALAKGKTENVKKKAKVERNLEETNIAVQRAKEEVESLTTKHHDSLAVIAKLETTLKSINCDHESTEKSLLQQKGVIEPVEAKLLEEQMSLKNKIKEMEFEENEMNQKLADMKVSQNAMQKRITATQASINNLNEDLTEAEIKLTTAESTHEGLRQQLGEAQRRVSERGRRHAGVMAGREAVRGELAGSVRGEVRENGELAQSYRELKSKHIDAKNRLMDLYDKKLQLELSIKDHKQLVALQQKMNHALKQYYFDRGEFNKSGLSKFNVRAHNNTDMMVKVQDGLDVAIDNISLFLKSQVDGSAVNRVHRAALEWLKS